MSDENIRMLLKALGGQVLGDQENPGGTVAMLFTETIRFRDKLKEETGEILTVGDTRIALDALEKYLREDEIPTDLTSEQTMLLRIWIDRLTIFKVS